MDFYIWSQGFPPFFGPPGRAEVYLVLGGYALALAFVLWRGRGDFARLRRGRLALFFALLVLTPLLNLLFFLMPEPGLVDLLPPPYLFAEPIPPALPLLGLLPVVVAGAWLGMGPATLIGLLAGVFRAGVSSHNILEPFTLAFQGALIAFLLRQDYRGRLPGLLRQPVLAVLLAQLVAWPIAFLSTFVSVYRPAGGLAALDYAWTLERFAVLLGATESLVHGLVLQALYLSPRLRPTVLARRPPPYVISLNRRFLFTIIPIFCLLMMILVYAVSWTAISIASKQAVDALARDAINGAEGAAGFISMGQSLIRQFATDPLLWGGDETACRQRLQSNLQMLPYFSRLTAYDSAGEVLCTYPAAPGGETVLTGIERDARDFVSQTGAPFSTPAHYGSDRHVILSFVSPLEDVAGFAFHGVLVGRVDIALSPPMDNVLSGLQQAMGRGEGFLVDDEGRIVAHLNPDRLLEDWAVDQSGPTLVDLPGQRGWVRESRDSLTNARQLVCYATVEGHQWAVVVMLPREVVLDLAINIARPLIGLLILITLGVAFLILLVTNQLTRPLNLLSRASAGIAAGDFDNPIHVAGDDEVARLGDAFEQMRLKLKDRLDDLSLLLRVSREVSATLDLSRGMPPVLEGALQTTGAIVARIVLLSSDGEPQVVMARGDSIDGIGVLDRALAIVSRDVDHPVLIENLSRASTLAEFGPLPRGVQSAIALPVRGKGRTVAVMWVGYGRPRRFDLSKVDLLSTMSSQTAVLVENARLFQMAEGGRRRLAAILASTRDAVLVTDRDDRILLVNPGAEQALGVRADELMGRRVDEVPLEPALVSVLTEPLSRTGALVEEVPVPDRRTFYASASIILSAEGENMGRVVVMRDITHLKELNEMKSEFVATVSHDLRAPLTFMRGYATMLPMVGDLNPKQQEYLEKILTGIEQTAGLVENLLDLGRIEAGVGMEQKPCHVGALVVEAVDSMRARATAKGLTIRLESADPPPVITGDVALLRQAVANLVDNAVKYTPAGGLVKVGLRTTPWEVLISVTDTGVGVAPEDQVRLFEKFFRIRRHELEDVTGTGLGLAIVKSIVERHGGRVWVESVLNKGSTFTIALPIRKPAQDDESAD